MTSLELLRLHLTGHPTPRLLCQPMLMMFAAKNANVPYIDYTRSGEKMAQVQIKVWKDFGVDCLLTCSDPAREVIDIAGDGSVEWFKDQGPVINETRAALLDISRLKKFQIPDPMKKGSRMFDRIHAISLMRKEVGQEVSIVGWVEGPLALAAELRGLNNLMFDFIDNPEFASDLLDFCAQVAIPYAMAQIEAGADTIAMSDAAASMIGPDLYHDFLHPRQKLVYESIKKKHPEVFTRSHMCGRTDELAGFMNELKVDIFEVDFPSSLPEMRRLLKNRIISGNVSTITDMMEGTPKSVYDAAAKCHQICGKYHIVNPGCEVSPLTPPENLRALFRYAHEHSP